MVPNARPDTFSWRAKEKVNSNARDAELCVVSSHHKQKRDATASVASGNVHEYAAARVGSGHVRENAVPRHWQTTCLMLITVRSQNMC